MHAIPRRLDFRATLFYHQGRAVTEGPIHAESKRYPTLYTLQDDSHKRSRFSLSIFYEPAIDSSGLYAFNVQIISSLSPVSTKSGEANCPIEVVVSLNV